MQLYWTCTWGTYCLFSSYDSRKSKVTRSTKQRLWFQVLHRRWYRRYFRPSARRKLENLVTRRTNESERFVVELLNTRHSYVQDTVATHRCYISQLHKPARCRWWRHRMIPGSHTTYPLPPIRLKTSSPCVPRVRCHPPATTLNCDFLLCIQQRIFPWKVGRAHPCIAKRHGNHLLWYSTWRSLELRVCLSKRTQKKHTPPVTLLSAFFESLKLGGHK